MAWILLSLLLLCVLIFIHELGHFWAGKALGFGINEFAIGFGPKLLSWQGKDGVRYSLRLLPLGGFCAFQDEEGNSDDPKSFNNQAAWKRFIVQIAGVAFNLIFAFALAAAFCALVGVPGDRVQVAQVLDGQAGAAAGLLPGDVIEQIDGSAATVDNAGELIASAPQQGFSVQVERDGQQKELRVQDAYQPMEKKNKIGIYYTPQIEPVGLGGSLRAGAVMTGRLSTEIFRAVGSLFTRPSEITSQMTGPIGTVSVMGDVLQEGFSSGDASGASAPTVDMRSGALSIMMLSIMLSVNLGVFNLLPLPALDGGRLVFTLIEMIARRPVPRNVQAAVNAVGLLLFLVLAVVLSVNDVGQLVVPGR